MRWEFIQGDRGYDISADKGRLVGRGSRKTENLKRSDFTCRGPFVCEVAGVPSRHPRCATSPVRGTKYPFAIAFSSVGSLALPCALELLSPADLHKADFHRKNPKCRAGPAQP